MAPGGARAMSDNLDKKTDVELKAEINRLEYELTRRKRPFTELEEAVWQAVLRVTRVDYALHTFVWVGYYRETPFGRGKYEDAIRLIDEFFKRYIGTLRRPERNLLLETFLECIKLSLPDNVNPSPKEILNQAPYIKWAVDQQFPGYADAKMLHHILKAGKTHE
jgi:hypothetical protein